MKANRNVSASPSLSPLDKLLSRGEDRLEYGDVDGAINDFSEAIRMSPTHAAAHIARADARMLVRRLAGAVTDYNEAIRLVPQCADYYTKRARALKAIGKSSDAKRDQEKARRLTPSGTWKAITKVGRIFGFGK